MQAADSCFAAPFCVRRKRPESQRRQLPRPYGALAKRQPTGGARTRQVEHVTQQERVWRSRHRRHGPHAKRGTGDCSLQGNRQHTPPAARPALGGRRAQGWRGALDTEPEQGAEELLALVAPSAPLRVARAPRRNKRDPRPGIGPRDGPTSPSEWGDATLRSSTRPRHWFNSVLILSVRASPELLITALCLKVSLRYGRRGGRLWPSGAAWWMTLSSGGPSPASGCSGCRKAPPRAVLATACCTATESMFHQRLAQAAVAAARTRRGARYALRRTRSRTKPRAWAFQRSPTLEPSTTSVCLRRSATRSTAPSMAAAHGCGCPDRVSGETSVASQHHDEVESATVLRSDLRGGGVGQPLLRKPAGVAVQRQRLSQAAPQSSEMPGGGGVSPSVSVNALVLPRLEAMPQCVSTLVVVLSRAARASSGTVSRHKGRPGRLSSRCCLAAAWQSASCCPSANSAGARGSPCSQPSPCGTVRHAPVTSHQQ